MGQAAVAIFELGSDVEPSQKQTAKAWQDARSSSRGTHLAFVVGKSIAGDELQASAATDADVTVIVEDAARATGGRASADLAAMIWQSFPSIAVLLSDRVSSAGAVIFSPTAFKRTEREIIDSSDPVTAAVLATVHAGGRIRAVLMPGDSNSALPSEPAELAPQSHRLESETRRSLIDTFDVAAALGKIASRADSTTVRAGLLLWHDFLEESHRHSQSIEGEGIQGSGDYWHAIMHRRERDYGNSKYWFRRVGRHPVFDALAARVVRNARDGGQAVEQIAARIAPDGRWDPCAFVDACQDAEKGRNAETDLFLRRIQADEMLLLLWQTCLDAKGET